MQLGKPELLLWYLGLFLRLGVCVFMFRRRLYRQLPVFSGYVVADFVRGLFIYGVYHSMGYASRQAFYSFWITQAVLLGWRAAAAGELAWMASRRYLGLRVVLKWGVVLVLSILATLVFWFALESPSKLPPFLLALERDLELAIALVLLALFWLAGHYQFGFARVQRWIAVGLFVYSVAQVVNNVISMQWLRPYFHWWGIVRLVSFHVALVIWLLALAKPVEEPVPDQSIDLQTARAFMAEGTHAMHGLSARLSRFRRRLP
jgi:hypothetical protein